MTYLIVGTGGLLFCRFRAEVKKGASFTLMTYPGGGSTRIAAWVPPSGLGCHVVSHPKGVRDPQLLHCPTFSLLLSFSSFVYSPEPKDRPKALGIKGRSMY